MEIGANWASTPGNSVAAGMKALKEGLPGIMEDTKANKKAMRDLDAAIYGLEHATRLEDLGRIKEAEAEKDKSQSLFLRNKDTWINVGLKKEELDQQRDITEKKIAADIKTAQIGAAGRGRDYSQMTGTAILSAKTEALKMANAIAASGEDEEYNNAPTSKAKMDRIKSIAEDYMSSQGIPQSIVEQPKSQIQTPPTVGEVRDGYKYNGGAYDSESSWSKV